MAAEIGVPTGHEVLLYVVHGMLHLVGFNDTDPQSAEKMRDAEREYLERFGITHHWVEQE